MMSFLIVSGMSGAGKTVALKTLEDMGYYCVDNLPVMLINQFVCLLKESGAHKDTAVGVDIRSGEDLNALGDVFTELDKNQIRYRILFLDASDSTLLRRFKETRRIHPIQNEGRLEDGIVTERKALEWLKEKSDYLIDTTSLLTRELKAELERIFRSQETFNNMVITVMSFGFKYGIPEDADLVFDTRFLPNPYYVQELKELTGMDEPVRKYVLETEDAASFLTMISDLLKFLIPRYVLEGKNQLMIGIGCTGGRHRSVAVANRIYEGLKDMKGYIVKSCHRDISK